ncbi:MAG: SpoIID/LytB domain-containing protein [Nitrospirae bacterium]|nr:SpoIID/LytB domain-containing protein [Nitrospirota bacterium]
MKRFLCITISIVVCFIASLLGAEETIKVLIIEKLKENIPLDSAQKFGGFNGKLSINGHVYKGSMDVRKDEKGLYVINELPLEEYVEGVITGEVGKNWDIEALKVQAVISRTYASYHKELNKDKDYHLTSTVLHQVYQGENSSPRITLAVKETEGEILTYEGKPIEAFYHSTCGERTELPDEVWGKNHPYLKSVECIDESSPYSNWKRKFTLEEIERALGIEGIKDIKILSFTSTGRVKTIKIIKEDSKTSGGISTPATSEAEVKAVDLRKLLGYKELPSTFFTIDITGQEITFTGKGYGHGVGLSQWGALEMAKKGKTYKEILEYYYYDVVLEKRR